MLAQMISFGARTQGWPFLSSLTLQDSIDIEFEQALVRNQYAETREANQTTNRTRISVVSRLRQPRHKVAS